MCDTYSNCAGSIFWVTIVVGVDTLDASTVSVPVAAKGKSQATRGKVSVKSSRFSNG